MLNGEREKIKPVDNKTKKHKTQRQNKQSVMQRGLNLGTDDLRKVSARRGPSQNQSNEDARQKSKTQNT